MANKMLIDATHPEETRVVVLRGNRVEEFDFESAQRKQLRGNIYLAKVTRVEPSLQAAFVDYGGNRHGFLAFSEIHPDYYQIPVADRQALIEEEQRAHRAADDELDRRSRHRGRSRHSASRQRDDVVHGEPSDTTPSDASAAETGQASGDEIAHHGETDAGANQWNALPEESAGDLTTPPESPAAAAAAPSVSDEPAPDEAAAGSPYMSSADATGEAIPEHALPAADIPASETTVAPEAAPFEGSVDAVSEGTGETSESATVARDGGDDHDGADNGDAEDGDNGEEIVESVGGADALEEVPDRAPRYRRQYKIQEVIKRRQVMLVQVVKEERGTKGAALTTYLSLAGRYSVLMPNTARGGGISRKITSGEDRSRLKEIAQELEVPEGMGVILRTAGASRTKTEIKRDFEYLLRLWETVRDLTLRSTAPKLVYEEGSLVKRSIRDLYSKDIDEVIVAGPEAYEEAKDFMRMLMPSHARNVKLYPDTQPLLSRYGVENQLDAMFSPVVQLRSGGYIVLNQAEALVAIDVNSGRATREHHIEDTALKTNLEASDEIARQLRLRDLAGLIVIDYIDMDEKRNNRAVERRLKECLKQDRARIQVGRISHFGLLEMSRQRIRASVLESSTEKCPYCGGSGHVRSVSSLALQVLRALEEQLMRGATHNLIARTRPDVALYVLNQKRAHLRALEERFAITITVSADESVRAPQAFIIERGEQVHTPEAARALAEQAQPVAVPLEEEDDLEEPAIAEGEAAEEQSGEEQSGEEQTAEDNGEQREGGARRRRRRRGRGGRGGRDDNQVGAETPIHGERAAHEAAGEVEGDAFADAEEDVPTGDDAPAGEPQDEARFEEGQDRQQDHGDPRGEQQGDRRRRRRGRRGGRRNRHEHDRNGDNGRDVHGRDEQQPNGEFAAADLDEQAAAEPELTRAIADLDAAPREPALPPAPYEAPFEAPVTAQSGEVVAPPAAEAAAPAPRRRSTVREAAPVSVNSEGSASPPAPAPVPTPAPEPVITEIDAGEGANRPRRTGWWSRRSAGG
jgi:ribonuclease E